MGTKYVNEWNNRPVGRLLVVVLYIHLMMAAAVRADEPLTTAGSSDAVSASDREGQTTLNADLATRLNPNGIMLTVGGYRRWSGGKDTDTDYPSPYLQGGLALGVNPAYAQAALHGEWMPATFVILRLQYDLYGFFGTNGALLSFPVADARFGKGELDALKGKEERGLGHRIMFQPTLRAKAGPVIVRNQTDLAFFSFGGKGPFFYEWEYDTLLKDGDLLVANRTQILLEAWKGRKDAMLLAGPFYDVTRASEAGLTGQKTGVGLYWVPAESLRSLDRPRIYSQAGVNLENRNRKGEAFFVLGCGFDFDLH